MARFIDFLEKILGAIVLIVLVAAPVVYLESESRLNKVYDVPLATINVPTDSASIAEGRRLARLRGCFWCHGEQFEGRAYFIRPDRGISLVAPNLTRKAIEYSDAEFARAIRHGVKGDGTSVQTAMPSFAYYYLRDRDVGAIIAYIRSLPYQEGLKGDFDLWPIGRIRHVAGKIPPNMAELIDHDEARLNGSPEMDPLVHGRYLVYSMCNECHGPGRIRVPLAPDLSVAAAYSKDDFERLLRTGLPPGERKIDYHMVDVAKYRYAEELKDEEIEALYAYLTRQPESE